MKKFKSFLSQKAFIRYIEILVAIGSIGAFAYTLKFLYTDFYPAVTQSEEIILMKEKTLVEPLNIRKFDQIIKNISDKAAVKEGGPVNNIFD